MRLWKRLTYVAFGLVILSICLGTFVKAQNSTPSAESILDKMTATYSNASSYQDSGVVRLVSNDPMIATRKGFFLQKAAFQSSTLISFKTYYLGPNRFRFEWKNLSTSDARESVVWSDGERAYRWMPSVSDNGEFELASSFDLEFYVDQALSPSIGSIFFVPSLLLPEVTVLPFGRRLTSAKQVSIVREEWVDGEMCYVIKASLSNVPWLLWIGKESYLLRKTRTRYSAKSFHPSNKNAGQSLFAEEIHSNIRINQGVPEGLFRYRPVFEPQDVDLTKMRGSSLKNPKKPSPKK